MKPYFATLLLSAFILPAHAQPLSSTPTDNTSSANTTSPMLAQSVKQPDAIKMLYPDHRTECFNLYSPERHPGVNCVPDE